MPAGAARAVQAVWEQRGPEAPPGGGGRGLGAFDERSESTDLGCVCYVWYVCESL